MTKLRSPKAATTIIVIGLAMCTVTVFARYIAVDPKIAPDPALPQAYEEAVKALGPKGTKFHCVGGFATGLVYTSGPTEWCFSFYAADGSFREVIISTKGKAIVRDQPTTEH